MTNTKGEGSGGDPFWEKSERLLLTALIAYLHYEAPVEEQNFATLLEMLNTMQVLEDDEEYQNPVDLLFVPGIRLHESPRQYDLENVSAAAVGDSPANEFLVLLVGDRAVFFPSQREVVGSEIAVADHAFDFVQTRIFAVRE